MHRKPANILRAAVDLLFPDTCLLCDQITTPARATHLCDYCLAALPHNFPSCVHCGLPLVSDLDAVCGPCRKRPMVADRCLVPLIHDDLSAWLVHQLKFRNGFREAECLARIIANAAKCTYADDRLPQLLIPVPLAYRNEVRRGYNQSWELAKSLSGMLSIRADPHVMSRRYGPSQRSLNRRERGKLKADTFRLIRPNRTIHADHVAVIDDVMTTGSTVRAMTSVLLGSGVDRVDVWCATRAVFA